MEYKIVIDQEKAKRYDLTKNEAALMYLCTQLPLWAEPLIIKGRTYYFLSRNKVIQELPYFYKKADTVRRAFNRLKQKKLIYYQREGIKDYVCLTRRCRDWKGVAESLENSEKIG